MFFYVWIEYFLSVGLYTFVPISEKKNNKFIKMYESFFPCV